MNADDRNAGTGHGLYTPRTPESGEQSTPARRAFMPVGVPTEAPAAQASPTAQAAPAPSPAPTAAPAASSAPTTGSIPQRTAVRPLSSPQGIPTTAPRAAAPAAAAPTAPVSTTATAPAAAAAAHAQAPARPAQPVEHPAPRFGSTGVPTAQVPQPAPEQAGVLGVGTAKLKDFAGRAAESFKAGDELSTPASKGGPRRARVLVSRIDPWSALKLGFLMSIAVGIMFVVAVFVMWNVLNEMGTFALVNGWVTDLFTTDQEINIMQFFDQNKVMSAAILLSVVNVVLLTALSTIIAFLYNVISSVVGGFYVTLTDD